MKGRFSHSQVSSKIKAAIPNRDDGFGGGCLSAAIKINKEVFNNKGKIVAAANTFWLKRKHFFGHVAVKYAGVFWDADAEPKPWDEIDSWAMLAPDDPDYFPDPEKDPDEAAEWPGVDDVLANGITKIEGEREVRKHWGAL